MRSKLLTFLIALVSTSFQGPYAFELSLIDTKLCSQKITTSEKELLKSSSSEDCLNDSNSPSKKYHANQMLKALNSKLSKKERLKIKITHHNVFDEQGKHAPQLWKQVIQELNARPAQLVVLAVGSPKKELYELKLPTKHFYLMAAGQNHKEFSKDALLWPQKQLIEGELKGLIIGSFSGVEGEISPDLAPALSAHLLHQKHIDYLFSESSDDKNFVGSSHAVALAGTKLIQLCGDKPLELWRSCLTKNQRELKLLRDQKALTF